MKPKSIYALIAALTVTGMATLGYSAAASGTYCACLPKPPDKTAKTKVDRDKYDLGQKVFTGRVASGQEDAVAQRPMLERLQAALPAKVARKKDLVVLAGRLTSPQLAALEYVVNQRYPTAK